MPCGNHAGGLGCPLPVSRVSGAWGWQGRMAVLAGGWETPDLPALRPESCSSPRWYSCRSLVSTTPSSWPCPTPKSQGPSGRSRCTTRCSSTPSRYSGCPGWGHSGGGCHGPDPMRLYLQGFFVAIIYCFCNGEVSSGHCQGGQRIQWSQVFCLSLCSFCPFFVPLSSPRMFSRQRRVFSEKSGPGPTRIWGFCSLCPAEGLPSPLFEFSNSDQGHSYPQALEPADSAPVACCWAVL